MFENMSTLTKVLMGATVVAAVATTVSAIKDAKEAKYCCLDCCEECAEELADPTASM
jgi:hypothetical protein